MVKSGKYIGLIKSPRLIEFTNSKFYSTDFLSPYIKFVTVFDKNGKILYEYAHLAKIEGYNQNCWATPDNHVFGGKAMIETMVDACFENNGIVIEIAVDDIYTSNKSLSVKRAFQYLMTPSKATKTTWCRYEHKHVERLYNVEPIDDIKCFHSIRQLGW